MSSNSDDKSSVVSEKSCVKLEISILLLLAGPVYLRERESDGTSGETRRKVDAEIARILREAYQRVTSLLVCHSQYRNYIQLQSN